MAAIETNINTWPQGIIPFVISANFKKGSQEFNEIAIAINEFNLRTNIRFFPRTNQADYIIFKSGQSGWCSSQVGRQGGEQSITCHLAGRQFSAGNLIHEIMHMLGFHHEHQRTDRDDYVKINFENVKRTFDFDMITGQNLTEYDYGSIMHYPRVIANTNLVKDPRKDTIIPLKSLDVETIIGQRGRLSTQDIQGINKLYPEVSGVKPLILKTTLIEIELASILILVFVVITLCSMIRRSNNPT